MEKDRFLTLENILHLSLQNLFSQEKVRFYSHLQVVPQSDFKKILKFTFEAVVSFRVLLIFVRRSCQGAGKSGKLIPQPTAAPA